MPGDRSEDELARTATAPGSPSTAAVTPAPELGATLGRYRLERALGEGGMGVVHAAFDPDLERRVALKVLRVAEGAGDEARQRLLREARAMARLTHTNVVTVHEVGTAGGRDYVAMELIEGGTLAEWLRAEPRTPREIVAAFVAAGRGLAAAHAAGLVHRDFKPHNVLRRKDGRVCVTDFGLARGVDAGGLEVTLRLQAGAKPENTPSALSGLTATGSVLGTPAYMAPEQWSGGPVGPAADQFAFCVALWEALAGERPFRGATLDLLKQEVARGPAELDASKLPRRLRPILRRGLDPDPARRWPNMDALLAALARAERRPWIALAGASAVVVAGAIAVLALHGKAPAGPSCDPPARRLDSVWTAASSQALAAAGRAELADVFQRDVDAWSRERSRACAAPPRQRAPELACLDGVLARLDVTHQAVEHVTGNLTADTVLPLLVDPAVCAAPVPPRLTMASTPDTVAAFALELAELRDDPAPKPADAAALAAKPGIEPCARAYALDVELGVEPDIAKVRALANDAVTASEACGDERLRADVLIDTMSLDYERPTIGPKGRAAIEKAKAAVDRVAQPDLVAEIDQARASVLADEQRWDDAFAAAERAIAGYAARGRVSAELDAAITENSIHMLRADVSDLEAIEAAEGKWKPIAAAHHLDAMVRRLEGSAAYAMLFLGDVMGAHAAILQDYHPVDHPDVQTQRIDGTVVDAAGQPVAGAIVAAGSQVWLDSVGPLPFGPTNDLRMVTSDAHGAFVIADAPLHGGLVAQLGPRRAFAPIEPHARLVIQPTRRVAGKVELNGTPRSKVFVMAVPGDDKDHTHFLMAPLQADGSFDLLGVPEDSSVVGVTSWSNFGYASAVAFQNLPPKGDVLNLDLAVSQSHRALTVIARSTLATSLDAATVYLLPGRLQFHTLGEMMKGGHHKANTQFQFRYAHPVVGEQAPAAAAGKLQAGDLLATFQGVPAGEVTVCACAISGDVSDPATWRKLGSHADQFEVRCATAGPDDQVIVVEAPPQKRMD